jgi:hypothetical protein
MKYTAIATVVMVTSFDDEDLREDQTPDEWAEEAFDEEFYGPFEEAHHSIQITVVNP